MFIPCNINGFWLIPCKKNCLDSNPVIWFWTFTNFDCTKSMIWQGCKPKFTQIAEGKSTLNFEIWDDPKPKNFQIILLKSKHFFY